VFGGGVYAVWDRRDAATVAVIVATGFMTALLAQLERFELLKGAGIEVKLRQVEAAKAEVISALESAQKAQAGAELAQEHIRHISSRMVSAILRDMPFLGLFGGTRPLHEKVETRDRLLDVLKEIGVSEADQGEASQEFNSQMRRILAIRATAALQNAAHDAILKEELQSKVNHPPPTDELLRIRLEKQLNSDEVTNTLGALQQFETRGTVPTEVDNK